MALGLLSQKTLRLAAVAAIMMSFEVSSCKSRPSLLASGAGSTNVGLVPTRALFVPPALQLYDDDARRVENATRLSYGIVECPGADGAKNLAVLQATAHKSADAVQRVRDNIAYSSDGASAMPSDCHLLGKHLMSIGSFVNIFGQKPTTQKQFETQQAIWLSLRGSRGAKDPSYIAGLSQFLSENLGAYPASSTSDMVVAFGKLDAAFNPCVKTADGTFNKTAAYSCGADSVPIVKDKGALGVQLVDVIGAGEENFLTKLAQKKSTAPQDDGWQIASRTDLSMKDLKKSGFVPPENLKVTMSLTAGATPTLDETRYAISDLLVDGKAEIESRFGIVYGPQPAPVLSKNNPRVLPVPPDRVSGVAPSSATATAIRGPNGAVYFPNLTIDSNAQIKANWQLWKLDPVRNQWQLLNDPGLPPLKAAAKTALALTAKMVFPTVAPNCASLGQILCLANANQCQWQSPEAACLPKALAPSAAPSGMGGSLLLADQSQSSPNQSMIFSPSGTDVDAFLGWTAVGKPGQDSPYILDSHNCQGFANTLAQSAVLSGAAESANLVSFNATDANNQGVGHALTQLNFSGGQSVLVEPNGANGNVRSDPFATPGDGRIPDDVVQSFVPQTNLSGSTDIKQSDGTFGSRAIGDTWNASQRVLNNSEGFQNDAARLGYTDQDINAMQAANDETRAAGFEWRKGQAGEAAEDWHDPAAGANSGDDSSDAASDSYTPQNSSGGDDFSDAGGYDQEAYNNGWDNLNSDSGSSDSSGDNGGDGGNWTADNSGDSGNVTTDNSSDNGSWADNSGGESVPSEFFGTGSEYDGGGGDTGSWDAGSWDNGSTDTGSWDSGSTDTGSWDGGGDGG